MDGTRFASLSHPMLPGDASRQHEQNAHAGSGNIQPESAEHPQSNFPQPNVVSTVFLDDGRQIEYAEYGDPAGRPLVFFHGFMGSFHQASLTHEPAMQHGFRVIAPNRPGVGHSTPHHPPTILDSIVDLQQVINANRIDTLAVLGVSGGVPYALATAYSLGVRVRAIAAVSGLGPVADPGLLTQMERSRRRTLRLASVPFVAKLYLAWRMRGYAKDPEGFLNALIECWHPADRILFRQPGLRAMILADLHSVLRQGEGTTGLAHELARFSRWGFELSKLPKGQKVFFWHATEDPVVPPVMTRHMASQITHAKANYIPGGHFAIVNIAEHVLQALRAAMA